MNVRELREQLQALEAQGMGELDVKFTYNYGDHWSTMVAADVANVETAMVKYSEYHSMDKVVDRDEDEDQQTPEDERAVVVLG